jgi:integrase
VNIDSKTARAKLDPKREPYWAKLDSGFYLGFRRLEVGGTWIARLRDDVTGKQLYHALGTFDDSERNEKAYPAAEEAARAWRGAQMSGVTQHDLTVWDACQHYLDYLEGRGKELTASDAKGRFARLVKDKSIARVALAKLTTKLVFAWLTSQVKAADPRDADALRSARASANRNLATLKAALNRAMKDRLAVGDSGWKTVAPFDDVRSRRGIGGNSHAYLSDEQRTALFSKCSPDLQALLRALLLTAARPGEIAACIVSDFDRKHGTLRIRDSKTGERVVTLSTAAIEFFNAQSQDRIGNAPLIIRVNGIAWKKDAWKKPIRTAVVAAGLPSDVVLYSLRHAAISEMISCGMSTAVVAMLAGTSAAMIEAQYGHLNHVKTREQLDGVRLSM